MGHSDPATLTRTTTRLIDGLREVGDNQAWEGFDARYRPVLVGVAIKLGFGGDDASELAQRALAEFAHGLRGGRYERGRGRLSAWLIGIARHIGSEMRRREKVHAVPGGSMIGQVEERFPDEARLTQIWQAERDAAILADALRTLQASERIDPRTLRAFELFALRGVPAEEVAKDCGMETETVYVVKNRLTKKLREIVRDLTSAYDEGE